MTDVLIVGAGPTGLTLGIDLRRSGVDVRLIERLPERVFASKGKGLQPRTLEVFDTLGIIDEVMAASSDYPVIRAYAGDRVVREQRMSELSAPTSEVPYPNLRMLPQWRTEDILAERFAALGGAIERGVALERLAQDESGVTAGLSTGETLRAAWLVGADGGHSIVRRAVGIGLVGDTPPLDRIAIADLRASGLDRTWWHAWAKGPGEVASLCPLPGTDAFQMTATLPAGSEPELSLAAFQALLDARSGRTDIVLSDMGWASLYRPNIRMAEHFRAGRVLLAGDAVHVHPPAGGQGLNTGVQDAHNLGWKLAAVLAGAPDGLLDTYEEERLPIAAHVLGLSEKLLRKGFAGDPDALERSADERQLTLTYRGSLLCAGQASGGLRPGDRMPDGVTPDGRRIFELLRDPGFAVLERDCHVFVVRPDGYIGGIFGTRAEAGTYIASIGRHGRPLRG